MAKSFVSFLTHGVVPVSSVQFVCSELMSYYRQLVTNAVFTCIGALGTPSRTGSLARKYLPGFPYS